MFLPGLVGSAPLWLRGCTQVETAYNSGEWLALEGERGVGKLAVIRAVHQRQDPAGHFSVLDAADATGHDWLVRVRRELLEGDGTLVLRHVDMLGAQAAEHRVERPEGGAGRRAAALAAGGGHPERQSATKRGPDQAAALFPGHAWNCRRCAITSRTCRSWCRSSWPSSASRRGWPARPRRCSCCCARAGRATPSSSGEVLRRVVQAPAHRDDPPGRPAAGMLDGQPPPAQPARVDGARRHRAGPAGLPRATRSRRPSRWGCPGPRSTGRSTNTGSSSPPAERPPRRLLSGHFWRAGGHPGRAARSLLAGLLRDPAQIGVRPGDDRGVATISGSS